MDMERTLWELPLVWIIHTTAALWKCGHYTVTVTTLWQIGH
jgi:hypothetical protein